MKSKKTIILLFILFLTMQTAFAFSLFGNDETIDEHTNAITITEPTTEVINHTNGWYIYTVNFEINNLSTADSVYITTYFFSNNQLVKSEGYFDKNGLYEVIFEDKEYNENYYDNDTGLEFYKHTIKNNYTQFIDCNNPTLKPIFTSSELIRFNYSNITHVKILIYDKTEDKILFQTTKPFNMTNYFLVNDTLNEIENGSYIKAEYNMNQTDIAVFDKLDSDSNHLITFKEFKSIKKIEKFNYYKSYSKSELKEEYDNLDSNNDNFLTITEFKQLL